LENLMTLATAVLLLAAAFPDSKVEMKGLHLCCGGCEGAALKALENTGAKNPSADRAAGTLTFTVRDAKAAQKAFDGLAAAGFHGDSGIKGLGIKDDSGVKPGKVESLTLAGAHNCCGSCATALKAAIAKVEGVTSDDLAPKAVKFTVKGSFDGAALVKAINDAGYHVKLSK
jgi:mercuric ion binding protein